MVLTPSLGLKQRQRLGLTQEIKSSLQYLALAGLRLEQALTDVLDSNPFLSVRSTHPIHSEADWLTNLASPGPESIATALRLLATDLFWTPEDKFLSDMLIDEVGDNGLLELPLADIAEDNRIELDRLRPIQDKFLAEGGLLADNLGHSLSAQAVAKVQVGDWPNEVLAEVLEACDLLDLIACGEFTPNAKILDLVRTLNPRPADNLDLEAAVIIPPDLIVEEYENNWRISLNPLTNRAYELDVDALGGLSPNEQKQPNIAEPIKTAKSTVRALKARKQTLVNLGYFLCKKQDAALRHGRAQLSPLTQMDAAEALDCHSSTISRAVAGKTIQTPQGVWPLRDFFSALIDPNSLLSGAQLRAWITETIFEENRTAPMSDAELAIKLSELGHEVARRTITKYRLHIGLPGAAARRRLYSRRSPNFKTYKKGKL